MSVNSTSNIGGGSAASSPSSAGVAKSDAGSLTGTTFASLMNDGTPYDEVKFDLPNGMSVGLVHFGGGGLDSDALKAFEDFAQKMGSQATSGSSASGADRAENDDPPGVVGLDKIHVDLPNGISFEVLHSSGDQPTDSAAVMKELTATSEELAEYFSQYSPASAAASAYAAQQAAASVGSGQVDAQT